MSANFTNPTTGTTHRLVRTGDAWRITKSRQLGDAVQLAHLRGQSGTDPLDMAAIGQFVAGSTIAGSNSDPLATFAAVILTDLDRSASLLTAVAHEAKQTYLSGCRGFRPRSPILKQQFDRTMTTAVSDMQAMAQAWEKSGHVAAIPLPNWLAAALDDLSRPESVS